MRIVSDTKLDFSDVLLVPKRSELSSRSEVGLFKNYTFKNSKRIYEGIPIVASNMDGVGTFGMALALAQYGLMTTLLKHYDVWDLITFFTQIRESGLIHNVAYSLGSTDEDLDKYHKVRDQVPIEHICIDVANGYSEKFISFVKRFRDDNPNSTIMAGNVATPEVIEQLILAGADIVKVGIGSGNACSTRIKTGVGYPQLSAIIECADAAHGLGGHIVGDGGITCPGDIVKAFAANADFVMIGGLFAGHTEGGGEVIREFEMTNLVTRNLLNGGLDHSTVTREYVEFYGMSSKKAQEVHGSGLKEYRASEGRVLRVPYKGGVDSTIQDMLGGLRSACTYSGARNLKELPKRATFVKVNQQISALYGLGKL